MHKATKITITLTALECNVAWSWSGHCGCNWNWEQVRGLAAFWLPHTGYWFCRQATKNFTRQTVAPLSEAQHSPFRLPHSPCTTLSPTSSPAPSQSWPGCSLIHCQLPWQPTCVCRATACRTCARRAHWQVSYVNLGAF